jgi:hypothetical protein
MQYLIAYVTSITMHFSVLEGALLQIQHVEDIFFAEILRNSDTPVTG